MAWGPGSTYLWGYTPYLNVFCILFTGSHRTQDPFPNVLMWGGTTVYINTSYWKDIFALFSWIRPDLPL